MLVNICGKFGAFATTPKIFVLGHLTIIIIMVIL